MRTAAKIVHFPPPVPRYRCWRHELERARSGLGLRCHTVHITDVQWRLRWARGLEPFDALIHELGYLE